MEQKSVSYARRLGLFSGTMAVIGGIIGSGIFLNPAIVAARVGSTSLTLAAWMLGGVVALLGAFIFGELAARNPRVGGGYAYLRDAFGPLPAFLYGWALLLIMATGAIAAVAFTFGTPPDSTLRTNAYGARSIKSRSPARREVNRTVGSSDVLKIT